jgi:PST family polysaccharide transporter
MKSIFRATAILSGSSFVSIICGLVSAKVLALVLLPAGYGYYGLVQSFVGFASLLTGMGIATGMVRLGAGAAARGDEAVVASLRSGAWLLLSGLGIGALLVLVLFRGTISQWVFGGKDHPTTILWLAIALFLTAAANMQIGVLNAYHRVASMAKYGVFNAVASASIIIGAVLVWHIRGVVPGAIAGAAVSWSVSGYLLRRDVGLVRVKPTPQESLRAAWSLLRFGGPFTASTLVGSGVQLALPMVVLHLLSTESVGYYRAAAAISVNYLGFLITSMGQDYYPRVSAVSGQPAALVKLINEQYRLVMLLAVPMILGTLALVPILVPLVYSGKFLPTVEILEWQLIGDMFKFSSWTVSFAILARCKSSIYLFMESIGGFTTIATTWLAVRLLGLPGLGISFLATYVIYYGVVWAVLRREIPLRLTSWNRRMMLAGASAAFLVRILPSTRFASFRTPVALAFALAFGIPSLITIWREFMRPDQVTSVAVLSQESQQTAIMG